MFGLAKMAATKKKKKFEEIQHGYSRDGVRYGVTISQDKDGYFAHTHRARCKSFPSIEAIPTSKLKFIDSTG